MRVTHELPFCTPMFGRLGSCTRERVEMLTQGPLADVGSLWRGSCFSVNRGFSLPKNAQLLGPPLVPMG